MIRNLTPHTLNFVFEGGRATETLSPDPAGPARVSEETATARFLQGIPLISRTMGRITGLPPACPDHALVVSLVVATEAWRQGRRDVLAIGETVRNPQGQIIGAKSLAVSPQGFSFLDAFGNPVSEDGEPIDGE